MVPGRGPVKIAAALAVAAAGLGGGLAYKKYKTYLHEKQRVRNARNVASAMRPPPNRNRKSVLFVTELLQSLGNSLANEREPRRNRSRQRKIGPFKTRRSAFSAPTRDSTRGAADAS